MVVLRRACGGDVPMALGFACFAGLMAAGAHYNMTFVQLGPVDPGERVLGLSEPAVALRMALLTFVTCATAVCADKGLQPGGHAVRARWRSKSLRRKWPAVTTCDPLEDPALRRRGAAGRMPVHRIGPTRSVLNPRRRVPEGVLLSPVASRGETVMRG